ncbi:MAG: ASCH domain-containing protein [Candidatus Saccharibacteria bacterium]|nr:ASCH domain-containing protein [Candidatus Saccharibacteria bacterium]
MQIHLDPEIYEQVANGTKNVEARVNDEKRQQLKAGDVIEVLKRPDEVESLKVKITDLKYFKDFSELADNYPIERLYSPSFTKEEYVALFPKFYSDEEINKYGTVAIEFEVVNE